jgi:4-amino-4-deoxy-L-arabinose transferase-like glycosyltransferase
VPELLRAIVLQGRDATPPAYYVLLSLIMQMSWDLWALRLISVLAGAALVWLAYRLALRLFDFPVAALTGLLLALAPFSIEVSQLARAYALASVFALASLYFFAKLRVPRSSTRTAWLYAAVTVAALGTHYLAAVVVLFQNLMVAGLALARQLPRRKVLEWFRLQALMGLVLLPLIWMAVQRMPASEPGRGQDWLPPPSVTGVVKSLILWGTGDPSYGGAAFTLARLFALALLAGLLGLGAVTAWRLWHTQPERRLEVQHIAFVAAAFFGIWGLALGVSLVRKIFHEKYFIYLAPLLIMLLAWTVLRLRPAWLGQGLLVALLATTGLALSVYYTSPNGEQWREAMTYIRQQWRPGDYVALTPGYYVRPATYYFTGEVAPDDFELARAPVTVIAPGGYRAATTTADPDIILPDVAEVLAQAERVWVVTGYAEIDPARLDWLTAHYERVDEREFLGVQVKLYARVALAVGGWPTRAALEARP